MMVIYGNLLISNLHLFKIIQSDKITNPLYTFVVVSPVVAVLFEEHVAIFAVPTVVTPALPLAIVADSALSVPGTGIWATFHGAVFSVPAGHAQASTVLTLAVFVASWIALLQIAQLARPSGQTVASVVHAMPVGTAIQIA